MEVTVHLDGNPAAREEGFFESKVVTLENQIKALQFFIIQTPLKTLEIKSQKKQK